MGRCVGKRALHLGNLLHGHHMLCQILPLGLLLALAQEQRLPKADVCSHCNRERLGYCSGKLKNPPLLLNRELCLNMICPQILVTIFQCQPVSAFWNRYDRPSTSYKCPVNVNQFFNGNSIPNIITDAALLLLPLPQIWGLSLPKTQKLAVMFIFALGVL